MFHLSFIASEKPLTLSESKGLHPFISSVNNYTVTWIILQFT